MWIKKDEAKFVTINKRKITVLEIVDWEESPRGDNIKICGLKMRTKCQIAKQRHNLGILILSFILFYFYGQIVFAMYKDLWDKVTNKIQ